jgi:hypothetical protein
MSTAQLVFLPWLREGVGAQVSGKNDRGLLANAGSFDVAMKLNDKQAGVERVRVLGPGDVVGIDSRQVIRTDPTPGSGSFEPTRFVSLELDSPSLPWLFTPHEPEGHHLSPWMTLVVVERRQGVTVLPDAALRATVLRIRRPADPDDELPDLAHAWAWGHVQVAAAAATEVSILDVVNNAPDRVLSRLVCPRRLRANTPYVACLVPTFAAGRDAGLGRTVDPDDPLELAWRRGDAEVTLPVYHAWEFSTGIDGDFSTLVERLKGQPAPDGVGEAALDITAAGARRGTTEQIAGALRRPEADTSAPPPAAVRTRLAGLVARESDDLRPPVYGGLQSGACEVPADASGWLADLNLDPRWRAAAAYGAALVREDQETLVAAAWLQAGEITEANALIERARLATEANESLMRRRLDLLPPQDLLEITAPLHERVRVLSTDMSSMVAASVLPDASVTAAYRRITRPGGPAARRKAAARRAALARGEKPAPEPAPVAVPQSAIPKTLAAAEKVLAPLTAVAVHRSSAHDEAVTLPSLAAMAPAAEGSKPVTVPPPDLLPALSEVLRTALAAETNVARRVAARLITHATAPAAVPVAAHGVTLPRSAPTTATTRAAVSTAGATLTSAARTAAAAPGTPQAALVPRKAAPSYNIPLYDGLARVAPDAVLPGVELVPEESVILLRSDPAFVAAFLAGFNTELGRELLWRGYPVDATATFARSFWDYRGRPGMAAADVSPIATWDRGTPLAGVATTPGGGDQLVLVVRGELLRRYPRTLTYAVRAQWVAAAGGAREAATEAKAQNVRHATFSGFIAPDLRFFGFDLDAGEARGGGSDPGWFFAFQEQATETRFGGAAPALTDPASASSASVALATRQPPMRVLMHAGALLAGTAPHGG